MSHSATVMKAQCFRVYLIMLAILFLVVVAIITNLISSSPNDTYLFCLFSSMVGALSGYLFGKT
jgi:hypothetical protein